MRLVFLAGLWSFLLTLGAALALRADSPVLAVAALAALLAAITWFAAQHSDEVVAGTTTTGTVASVALTLGGRSPAPLLLPLVTAQAIGAVAAGGLGAAAEALDDAALTPALAFDEPALSATLAAGLLIGLVSGWLMVFVDGYLTEGVAAIPVLLGGGLLSAGYAVAVAPAALIGLAVAGLTAWPTSLWLAGTVLIGAAIAGLSVSWLIPSTIMSSQNTDT